MEIFRNVLGYDGIYQVSNLGNVKSLEKKAKGRNGSFRTIKERILKAGISGGNRYLKVSLWKDEKPKTRMIHQLVAESFLNHKPDGMKLVVNHINHNKLDNRVENLEIVTSRENANQKHMKSTSKYVGVSWDKESKKWRAFIHLKGNTKHLGRFINEIDAHNAYKNALNKTL